jgi:GT2 family glycosyltransferase
MVIFVNPETPIVKVSAIIVNYNRKDLTAACLKSLLNQTFKDFEIILVDNGSTDDSLELVRLFSEENRLGKRMKIVPLQHNRGFAGGNIAGLTHADAEFIALLNNDTEPDKEWLRSLSEAMGKNPEIGICASKMIVHGTNTIDSAGDGFATSLKGFKRGEGQNEDAYNSREYIFGACAGAALYRRKMLDDIGFFDDDFFLIHEDTDLNLRAQLAGWKVLYVPEAVVHHKVRSSIGQMSDMAVYYTLRNSELVRIKNIPLGLFLRVMPAFILTVIFEFLYFAVRHGKAGLYVRAKLDAIKMLKSMLLKRSKVMGMRRVSNSYLYRMMVPVWNMNFFLSKIKKFIRT